MMGSENDLTLAWEQPDDSFDTADSGVALAVEPTQSDDGDTTMDLGIALPVEPLRDIDVWLEIESQNDAECQQLHREMEIEMTRKEAVMKELGPARRSAFDEMYMVGHADCGSPALVNSLEDRRQRYRNLITLNRINRQAGERALQDTETGLM